MHELSPWRLWIDTGGTFTDCLASDPRGGEHRAKVLSTGALRLAVRHITSTGVAALNHSWHAPSGDLTGFHCEWGGGAGVVATHDSVANTITLRDCRGRALGGGDVLTLSTGETAPIVGARLITATPAGAPLPPIDMRLATTRATNVLLERAGGPVAFFVTRGFHDLLTIGDQTRPDLFALRVRRAEPLASFTVEVEERLDATGAVVRPLNIEVLHRQARSARERGANSAAVAFVHSDINPAHERSAEAVLLEAGFAHVSTSASLAPMIGILPRAQTAVVDAYVAPTVRHYLDAVANTLRGKPLTVITSAGGLSRAQEATSKDMLLSGPAGGVVGAKEAAGRHGITRFIGFDMGGTSTDVARFDNDFEYRFQTRVDNASILSPSLAIETVAAGGGSICGWRGGRVHVGPESAGASPGPASYGQGGPLTITDVNLVLGRLDPSRFAVPLDVKAAQSALEHTIRGAEAAGARSLPNQDWLEAFLAVADERMAEAMRRVSVRQGVDPTSYALVSFGGAGGQHACRVARRLGMRTVLMPAAASYLSAAGLRHARVERFAERQILRPLEGAFDDLRILLRALDEEACAKVKRDGAPSAMVHRRIVHVRLKGQESSLAFDFNDPAAIRESFAASYWRTYGHHPPDRPIEVESIRVIAVEASSDDDPALSPWSIAKTHQPVLPATCGSEMPIRRHDDLVIGERIAGPVMVTGDATTLIVERGWAALVTDDRSLLLRGEWDRTAQAADLNERMHWNLARQEVFVHRFVAIATEMGEQLQRTAVSTNVKERRDFSCALLDSSGRLLVNAPHIPVHLGALGLCVRRVRELLPMEPGDVVVTNHPAHGGSHLPDITVITPAFHDAGQLLGYAANRAHHAEIGGTRPGSMPPRARTLEEEGVLIEPMYLVRAGVARFDEVQSLLAGAKHPSRAVGDNLADLRSQVAANERGVQALAAMAREHGSNEVLRRMDDIIVHAATVTEAALRRLGQCRVAAEEHLDDDSLIRVAVMVEDGRAVIDFSGSSPVHPGNLNATPAIVHGAVIYVLRLLVGEALPLNEGIMSRITVILPPRTILNPEFDPDPARCPAVVGGNTETSQRMVDTLMKALKLASASQGTMNNVLFGNARFGYYETVCGGCGAGEGFHGASAAHSHMTNTRLTDVEVMERRYPVCVEEFSIRRDSGGDGMFRGGDGVRRVFRFLEPVELSVLSQRRASGPFGLHGGRSGMPGRQWIERADGSVIALGSMDGCSIVPGDRFILETPGGGGWGGVA